MRKIINIIIYFIVFCMIFLSCLNMINYSFFDHYRHYLIIFFLISNVFIFLLNIDEIINKEREIFIISFIGIAFYIFTRVFFPDDTITRLGTTLLLINLFLTIINFNSLFLSEKVKKFFLFFISIFALFFIPIHLSINMGYNSNTVSTFSFTLMIYVFIWVNYKKSHKFLSCLIFIIFFFFSFYFQCRSVILGELFFVFLIISKISFKYKLFSRVFLYIANISATIFPFIWVLLWENNIYFVIPFIGKQSIYTGRERVWAHFLDLFSENPIFGIGEGNLPIPLIDYRTFAPHNFMFNILVVYGIIIFIIVFFVLIYIFNEKLKNIKSNNKSSLIAYNGLIGIMFTSVFEIMPISYIHVVMIWFLLVILNSKKV